MDIIDTVLIPLDGSALAEEAIPSGRAIARQAGASLHFVRVVPPTASPDAKESAATYLDRVARETADTLPVTFEVLVGIPAEQILNAAADRPNPMIVMTTHGRTGMGRWLIGSVADRVVRGGSIAVLLLRSGVPMQPAIRRIVVPLDGSAASESALIYAEALAQLFGSTITLIRVAETTQILSIFGMAQTPLAGEVMQRLIADLSDEATTYLSGTAEQLRARGMAVETTTSAGIPAEEILGYLQRDRADLTVMTTRGRGGMSRFVLGSVAERLVRLGRTPLLLIHAADAAPPAQREAAQQHDEKSATEPNTAR